MAGGRDHPRVCGEQSWRRGPRPSPGRITPACAGNRSTEVFPKSADSDHPRVCGEQRPPSSTMAAKIGSPPRVRGTEDLRRQGGGHRRITPACAGNRRTVPKARLAPPDHPRVCGEQPDARLCRRDHYGSPPRVRGTEIHVTANVYAIRITPACAGNSGWLGT